MGLPSLKGETALVTGASSGLGVDFARRLAEMGANLVLVARREGPMQELAAELKAKHGISARVIPMDLARPEAPRELHETLEREGVPVSILVNNAGFGVYGSFLDLEWDRERGMLELDILTLVDMTKRFARDMARRGHGYLLQVSSIGAFQPTPTYATYSAAKTFVLYFGEALNRELKGTGVSCTVLCPGVTATEFLQVSGQKPTAYQRMAMMTGDRVVREGLRAMLRRRASLVPGLANALSAFSTRLISRQAAADLANSLMR